MHLYLVQHAEAKSKEEDPQRHLSDRGLADVEKVAAFAAAHALLKVPRIIHSGKTRAQQTADILAKHLKPAGGVRALDPLADPSIWADKLADEREDLMLVGHLPHLDRLTARLVCGNAESSVVRFQMAGIVALEKDESGDWRVQWMVMPDVVK
jgi:phosphohistidine phosphatase